MFKIQNINKDRLLIFHCNYLFDNCCQTHGQTKTNIEIMLHHKELLAGEECAHTSQEHVGTSHTSLGVHCIEPLLREDETADWSLLNWSLAGWEVDQVSLHVGSRHGQASDHHLLGLDT